MNKKAIAVLFGGVSPEYPVSLQSAHAVITHIDTAKYVPILLGITQEGHWFRYRGPAGNILNDTWQHDPYCTPALISPCRQNARLVEYGAGGMVFTRLDAAFPVMHGSFGEDGTMQGLLELAGIPIVGCGALASALCMDKDMAHKLVASEGIEVPASFAFPRGTSFAAMETAANALGWPVFVKPVRAGSSFGISKVATARGLASAIDKAFQYDAQVVIEQAVEGFEVGCAVMGKDELAMGELDEIELADGFFDYTEKYNLITSQIHVPARIAPEQAAEIKRTAARIYKRLGCSGLARVDQFLTPDGRIVFNEVNTIPGFTEHSRFPNMMKAAGMDFPAVIDKLLETAVAV